MANTDLSGDHPAAMELGPGLFQAVADIVHVAIVVGVLVYFLRFFTENFIRPTEIGGKRRILAGIDGTI